jgi:TusA-related sulfurtransferase
MYCPIPVYKARQAVLEANTGQVIELFADDPASEEDITRWAQRTGNTILKLEKSDDTIRFLIKKTER